jgi:hypothetical protein
MYKLTLLSIVMQAVDTLSNVSESFRKQSMPLIIQNPLAWSQGVILYLIFLFLICA